MNYSKYKMRYKGYMVSAGVTGTWVIKNSNLSTAAFLSVNLTKAESKRFIEGYRMGLDAGKQIGQMEEGERISKLLGLTT